MKDSKSTGINFIPQHVDSLSGHPTPALPSYICLRPDKFLYELAEHTQQTASGF